MPRDDMKLAEWKGLDAMGQAATRSGFGEGLVLAGDEDPDVIALCADLTESLRMTEFKEKYPDRFVQLGVHEQLLAALGAGFAMAGKVPFIGTFAIFCPGRAWEQVRTNICLNDANVKIAGSHAGLSVGEDGATHQALEDIAITRCIPNLTVIVPCDAIQTKKATLAVARTEGPAYLRFARPKSAVITTEDTPFEIGKAQVFRKGKDAAIVACGLMVPAALAAAEELAEDGVDCMVVNNHTIKPMDEEAIVAAAGCGAVVTVEEHQVQGGMGSRVAEILAAHAPVPMEFIGVDDAFGQSGPSDGLMEEYGLTVNDIKDAVRRVIERK